MAKDSLIDVIESLLEADMTKPDQVKNPQEEEKDEDLEEAQGEKLEKAPSKDEVAAKNNDKEGDGKGHDAGKSPDKEEINKAPALGEGKKETEEDLTAKQKKLDKDGDGDIGADDLKKVRAGEETEDEMEEANDPNHTKINKAEEPKSGSGKVAGKDGKMNVEAKDDEHAEEDEMEEANDPNHTKINKAEEPKSGSGKVAGKDGKMNVEAADEHDEEEMEEAADEASNKKNMKTDQKPQDAGGDPDKEEINKAPAVNEEDEKDDDGDDGDDTIINVDNDGDDDEESDDKEDDGDDDEEVKEGKLPPALQAAIDKKKGKSDDKDEVEEEADEEEQMEEDFKVKAAVIFEAAVGEKVSLIREELQTEYDEKLDEQVTQMNEKISEYVDYAVQEWVKENSLEIKYSLRTEIAENFIHGLKNLFEESYIDIPEEDVSVVDELTESVESYKEQLEEASAELTTVKQQVLEMQRAKIVEDISEDLTQTQALRLEKLAEGLEASDVEEFRHKVEELKEGYFDAASSEPFLGSLTEEVLGGTEIIDEDDQSSISQYAKFLSKTVLK